MRNKRPLLRFAAAVLLVSMNMRPAITSIAPLLETIQEQLRLNSTMASLLTAIPVICMGVFAPLAAKLGRFGLERIIAACLLLLFFATGLRYTAGSSAVLLLTTAAMIGIGLAVAGPALSSHIKRHFPEQAAFMVGLYSIGIGLGASLGAGLTVPFQHQLAGQWSAALSVWSVLALVSMLYWLYATRDTAVHIAAEGNPGKKPFPWRNKRAILVMLFFGLQGCLHYSVTAWIAPIAQDNGLTDALSGSVVTLFTLLQMGASLLLPILVHRYSNRRFWLLNASCVMLLGLLMLSFLHHTAVPWIGAVLLGYGAGALFFFALLLPLEETEHAEDAGAWTSMVQCGGYLMAGLGPAFTGWIHDRTGSYSDAFLGLSAIGLLVIAVSLALSGTRIGNRTETTETFEA